MINLGREKLTDCDMVQFIAQKTAMLEDLGSRISDLGSTPSNGQTLSEVRLGKVRLGELILGFPKQ
jgi:hypothetical protein